MPYFEGRFSAEARKKKLDAMEQEAVKPKAKAPAKPKPAPKAKPKKSIESSVSDDFWGR